MPLHLYIHRNSSHTLCQMSQMCFPAFVPVNTAATLGFRGGDAAAKPGDLFRRQRGRTLRFTVAAARWRSIPSLMQVALNGD